MTNIECKTTCIRCRSVAVALFSTLVLLGTISCKGSLDGQEIWTSEAVLRKLVTYQVKPDLVDVSRDSARTGVAVALVTLSSNGKLKSVSMLESPTPHVGEEITAAVRKWRFAWHGDRPDDILEARLTFYIVNGPKGFAVLSSDEAPSYLALKSMMVDGATGH